MIVNAVGPAVSAGHLTDGSPVELADIHLSCETPSMLEAGLVRLESFFHRVRYFARKQVL